MPSIRCSSTLIMTFAGTACKTDAAFLTILHLLQNKRYLLYTKIQYILAFRYTHSERQKLVYGFHILMLCENFLGAIISEPITTCPACKETMNYPQTKFQTTTVSFLMSFRANECMCCYKRVFHLLYIRNMCITNRFLLYNKHYLVAVNTNVGYHNIQFVCHTQTFIYLQSKIFVIQKKV